MNIKNLTIDDLSPLTPLKAIRTNERMSELRGRISDLEAKSKEAVNLMNSAIIQKEWAVVETCSKNLIYFDVRLEELRRELANERQAFDATAVEAIS